MISIFQAVLYILITASIVGMAFCLFILGRNTRVFEYRNKLIDAVYSHPEWEELRQVYLGTSYHDMVYRFWKPLGSFYDEDFLRKIGVKK